MRVVCFACEHGSARAFDLAGEERMPLPPEVTLVRLPCLGRLETVHVLRAFREGADAVMVVGCLEGNCHHVYGNLEAAKRVRLAQDLLQAVGLERGRLELFHVAPDQAWKAKQAAEAMVERTRALGPSPLAVRG